MEHFWILLSVLCVCWGIMSSMIFFRCVIISFKNKEYGGFWGIVFMIIIAIMSWTFFHMAYVISPIVGG
jgi:hypothetical protein